MPEPLPQQRKGKGKASGIQPAKPAQSIIESMASNSTQNDRTQEKIRLCVAGYQIVGSRQLNWLSCIAKFDSGADDDWISEALATRIGFLSKDVAPLMCKNFDGSIFLSRKCIERLTWVRDKTTKSISGSFRVMPSAPYDIVIGKTTLFREKIFSKDTIIHNAGVLVTKKVTKEEIEQNQARAEKHKADSEALLAQQALAQQKRREAAKNNNRGGIGRQ